MKISWRTHHGLGFMLRASCLVVATTMGMRWLLHQPLRFDLTEEQRYSLSEATIKQLKHLEAPLYVELFLAGKLPSGFRRLRNATIDLLKRMQAVAGRRQMHLRYTNPMEGKNATARRNYLRTLAQQGIQPISLNYSEGEQSIRRLIFPSLQLSYQGRELSISLLHGSQQGGPEAILNQSIEALEYHLLQSILRLLGNKARKLGWLNTPPHNTADSAQRMHLRATLQTEGYQVIPLRLHEYASIENLPCLLIANPTTTLSTQEQYHLDQYLMRGGQLLLFADGIRIAADSVSDSGTVAQQQPTGLEELLFHYGLRLVPQLVTDRYAAPRPIITGTLGNQPQIELLPWPYFPIAHPQNKHPIVRHTEAYIMRYASWLDTVKADHVHKEALFTSSAQTRLIALPAVVALNELRTPQPVNSYRNSNHPMGYLLEGTFLSAFRNRPQPAGANTARAMQKKSLPTRLIVVSDSQFPFGEPHPRSGEILEIGYHLSEQRQYGNRDFLLQALNYLYEPEIIALTRNRSIQLRPLDKQKLKQNHSYYQWLALLLPLSIIALIASLKYLLRKQRNNHDILMIKAQTKAP